MPGTYAPQRAAHRQRDDVIAVDHERVRSLDEVEGHLRKAQIELDRRGRLHVELERDGLALDRPGAVGRERHRDQGRRSTSRPSPTTSANGAPTAISSGRRSASPRKSASAAKPVYHELRGRAASRPRVFRRRRRHGVERLLDDVLGADAPHPELGPQHEPVRERRHRDALTSSGVTKSRPSSAARRRASFRSASEPRGLAPTST